VKGLEIEIDVFKEAVKNEPILQFFEFSHLPENLQNISRPFCLVAMKVYLELPKNPERTACLRKTLEAKDCAVRSYIFKN